MEYLNKAFNNEKVIKLMNKKIHKNIHLGFLTFKNNKTNNGIVVKIKSEILA